MTLRIGDEVDVDDGPKFDHTVSKGYFVISIYLCSDGSMQVGAMTLDSSRVSAPLLTFFPTGRSWNDVERATIVAHMKKFDR